MSNTETKNTLKNEQTAERYIMQAIKLPYVKINREDFLFSILKNEDSSNVIKFIETGDSSIFSRKDIDKLAKKVIKEETYRSTTASFAAGLPGGFSAVGTVPADILQNLAHSLRLAQKLAYLYGEEDLYDTNGKLQEKGKNTLIAYFGTMLGVSSATAAVGLFSKNAPKEVVKAISKTSVTKTFWYPIIKSVLKYFGVSVTKEGLKGFAKKEIPIAGGFISGGMTYVALSKSGERLRKRLSEVTYDYTVEKGNADLREVVKEYEENEL